MAEIDSCSTSSQPESSIAPHPEGSSVSRPQSNADPPPESSSAPQPEVSVSVPEGNSAPQPASSSPSDALSESKDLMSIKDDLKARKQHFQNIETPEQKAGAVIVSTNNNSARDASSKNESWVMLIKEGLKHHARNKRRAGPRPDKIMCRVRKQLRQIKPEHYDVEGFSFGLFDRPPLDVQKRIEDKCKLAVASLVLEFMGLEGDWEQLCRLVVPNPNEMQNLYDEFERDPLSVEEVQSVLTLDAVFLACHLGLLYRPFADRFPSFKSSIDLTFPESLYDVLITDLFKVENQMPLCLIRKVLNILVQRVGMDLDYAQRTKLVESTLTWICGTAVTHLYYLLPGAEYPYDLPTTGISYEKCDNFLECMYHAMCKDMKDEKQGEEDEEPSRLRFLALWLSGLGWFDELRARVISCLFPIHKIRVLPCRERKPKEEQEDEEEEPEDEEDRKGFKEDVVQHLPSAAELYKAGVQFRGRKGKSLNVEFEAGWLKATLYLPTVEVSNVTEAVWRNLLVYEEGNLPNEDFCYYLVLMDSLIDSPDDVETLKSGRQPVLLGKALGSNEDVARIFNNTLIENIKVWNSSEKWRSTFKKISEFHNQELRKMYWEFIQANFGKPWLTISVLAATVLLIMTLLQTYYTIAGYYHSS